MKTVFKCFQSAEIDAERRARLLAVVLLRWRFPWRTLSRAAAAVYPWQRPLRSSRLKPTQAGCAAHELAQSCRVAPSGSTFGTRGAAPPRLAASIHRGHRDSELLSTQGNAAFGDSKIQISITTIREVYHSDSA